MPQPLTFLSFLVSYQSTLQPSVFTSAPPQLLHLQTSLFSSSSGLLDLQFLKSQTLKLYKCNANANLHIKTCFSIRRKCTYSEPA
ncbi:unnamed protein product [Coffea canephora]|uniref:DH200=94 genomic scaffold, scaffold_163 n=1 Tax=Coffea canephora TaxID=49390 RepID=A0A068VA90_COFCA|nr:unnamed protein product [Coffea canephora]